MIVLGITDGISCGAAIVRDGAVLAAVNEEALCRKKMAYGFPRDSIREVLRVSGVAPEDLDLITPATINNHFYDGIKPWSGWMDTNRGRLREAIRTVAGEAAWLFPVPGAEKLYYSMRKPVFTARTKRIEEILQQEFGLTAPIEFIDHHLAHSTSAYFTSGFTDALAVSMDGGGDGMSSRVYVVRDGVFEHIAQTPAFHSLGNYYSYVTQLCGFTPQKHEGKITGLAAHGEPRYLDALDELITLADGKFDNAGRAMFQSGPRLLEKRLPENWSREDLSASIQIHCENLATRYLQGLMGQIEDPPTDLALSGGLFANVRINQKMAEMPGIRRCFVHPGMTDCGLAVGAALAKCAKTDGVAPMPPVSQPISNVYFGAGFTDQEIEASLDESGLEYARADVPERRIAELLRDGYVVARFNGRMEYGPRALGNRSILYQPGDPSVNDWLNTLLKRTEFMPYAPSTLFEDAELCYKNVEIARDSARFMTITFDCTDWMKRHCSGVVHIDGTARPQLVRREDNRSYYEILRHFRELTGIGTVINTSFNMHEEPIVYTPSDAIRSFRQGNLDYLAVGSFIVKSPEPLKHELKPVVSAEAVA